VDGLRVRVSLYAAALVTGGAFSILFTGEISEGVESFSSPGKALLVMLGAALVALLVGSAGRYRFVLVFPATALYALLAVYGRPPLFSLSAWKELTARIAADVYEAASIMYVEPVPYDLTPGLLVSLIPVVMVVVAFSVSATLYEESPVISVTVLGLTIGVLSTISFEDGAGPFFFLFLICAVALLLAAGPAERAGRIGWPGVVAGLAVVALVLALPRAPLAEKTLSTGLIDWTHIGTGGTSRLDVQADVGDYLTAGRDAELMRVHSPEPLLWRAGTLDYFDGVRWSDTTQPGDDDGEEIAPGIETDSVVQSVEILDAEADRVFGGYRIVVVSLDSAQQNSDSSWSLSTPLTEGDYYRVLSEIPQPSEEQLQSAGTSYPSGVRERFLQLPENRPEVLAETAQKIQDDYSPDNPYETARAIERYLLYDGGFTYNLDADFRRADRAIEEFLGDGKEGFCTQFATSMALLARELDVPSRVVYGATPGRETGTDEYVVTGTNMHTWVEVYFPGVGWYPFDPTPGFSVPNAMEANAPRPENPAAAQGLSPERPDLRRAGAQADRQTPREPRQTPAADESSSATRERLPAWPVYAVAAALLLAAAPLAKRLLLARGRPEDLYRDLTGRLRDVLPLGRGTLADSPALTPTERIILLAGAAGVEEEPFAEFARAYSDHLYSAHHNPDISRAHRGAVRAMGRLPLWRRLLGSLNPASLLFRARHSLAALRMRLAKALRGRRGQSRR
jgi:transglutaminase-like putative cysteine protease